MPYRIRQGLDIKIQLRQADIFLYLNCSHLGPDGKPTAVDHVLELVENHSAQIGDLQPREESEDSDDN